jgi:hypothetical protein
MDYDINDVLNHVSKLAEAGDLDGAELLLDQQIDELDKALGRKGKKAKPGKDIADDWSGTGTDDNTDDDGDEDDVSKAIKKIESFTNQITKVAQASGTHALREATLDKALDEAEQEIAKLGAPGQHDGYRRYPHSETTDLLDHQNLQHTGTTTHFVDRAHQGVTLVDQEAPRHKFDDLVDAVCERDGCSRMQGMTIARIENPSVYTQYQRWHLGNTAQEQWDSREDSNDDLANKAAPAVVNYPAGQHEQVLQSSRGRVKQHQRRPKRHNLATPPHLAAKSFESAVEEEIRKSGGYMTEEVAGQRVVNSLGNLPRETFAKGDDLYERLADAADGLLESGAATDRCDALRKARQQHNQLYKRLQAI